MPRARVIGSDRVKGELREALQELHGLTVGGLLTEAQEEAIRTTPACYVGWEAVDYVERAMADIRRRFRVVTVRDAPKAPRVRGAADGSNSERDDKLDISPTHQDATRRSPGGQGAVLRRRGYRDAMRQVERAV